MAGSRPGRRTGITRSRARPPRQQAQPRDDDRGERNREHQAALHTPPRRRRRERLVERGQRRRRRESRELLASKRQELGAPRVGRAHRDLARDRRVHDRPRIDGPLPHQDLVAPGAAFRDGRRRVGGQVGGRDVRARLAPGPLPRSVVPTVRIERRGGHVAEVATRRGRGAKRLVVVEPLERDDRDPVVELRAPFRDGFSERGGGDAAGG